MSKTSIFSPFIVTLTVILTACGFTQDNDRVLMADPLFHEQDSALSHYEQYSDTIKIKYAKGLKVSYEKDCVHVLISNPDPAAKGGKPEEFIVHEGKKRFICTTALQLGNFEVLGLENYIVGTNSLKNVFSVQILNQMESGQTVTIGKEGNFDLETVIAAKPDYILVSASKHGGFEALRESGIPLIPHHGYKETSPLGQAEWIKLIGILTGETRRANAVFSDIERKYITLKQEVERLEVEGSRFKVQGSRLKVGGEKLPTVISGRQIRDGWYIVGGKSYMAQIFKDAGALYIMSENKESGGVTLDFETVYAKGIHADFWQTDGSYNGDFTLKTLAQEDERYTTMDAYKNKRVLFCNLSQTPYRELAGVQPHFLLADFVKAFHPELLPHYVPKYYSPLLTSPKGGNVDR